MSDHNLMDADVGADGDSLDVTSDVAASEDRPSWGAAIVCWGPVARVRAWFNSPWDRDRVWRFGFTSFALVVTTTVMMNVVHFNPLTSRRRSDL